MFHHGTKTKSKWRQLFVMGTQEHASGIFSVAVAVVYLLSLSPYALVRTCSKNLIFEEYRLKYSLNRRRTPHEHDYSGQVYSSRCPLLSDVTDKPTFSASPRLSCLGPSIDFNLYPPPCLCTFLVE